MKKLIIFLTLIISSSLFSQKKNNDYNIYSKTIEYQLKELNSQVLLYRSKPIKKIIIIEKLSFDFIDDHKIFNNIKKAKNNILKNIIKDSMMLNRFLLDKNLIKVLPILDTNFKNHPLLIIDSLNLKLKKITTISIDTYKRKVQKINKKLNNAFAFSFSKINYYKNYAALYYWVDCNYFASCKSEHVIIFEKRQSEWDILYDFHLWTYSKK